MAQLRRSWALGPVAGDDALTAQLPMTLLAMVMALAWGAAPPSDLGVACSRGKEIVLAEVALSWHLGVAARALSVFYDGVSEVFELGDSAGKMIRLTKKKNVYWLKLKPTESSGGSERDVMTWRRP